MTLPTRTAVRVHTHYPTALRSRCTTPSICARGPTHLPHVTGLLILGRTTVAAPHRTPHYTHALGPTTPTPPPPPPVMVVRGRCCSADTTIWLAPVSSPHLPPSDTTQDTHTYSYTHVYFPATTLPTTPYPPPHYHMFTTLHWVHFTLAMDRHTCNLLLIYYHYQL